MQAHKRFKKGSTIQKFSKYFLAFFYTFYKKDTPKSKFGFVLKSRSYFFFKYFPHLSSYSQYLHSNNFKSDYAKFQYFVLNEKINVLFNKLY